MQKIITSVIAILIVCTVVTISGVPIKIVESSPESHTKNIMVTGYWNPTGQMIAPLSTNKWLNPSGWKGGNWNGTGYDIYSFFPAPNTYNGTLEVDYQNTVADFLNISASLHPVAILSFGAGTHSQLGCDWLIEYSARNLGTGTSGWVSDSNPPDYPTPCPPDSSEPVGYVRHSTLPMKAIADAVNSSTTLVSSIDYPGYPGAYLCEFMAYYGMWYQNQHNLTSDPSQCQAAGFIHVSSDTLTVSRCMSSVNVTLTELIKYLKSLAVPEISSLLDVIGFTAIFILVSTITKRQVRTQKD